MNARCLLALAALACGAPPSLPGAETDFVVDDPQLADEVRAAAAMWADAGLDVAEFVTVNQDDAGVVVRVRPQADLPTLCNGATAPEGATVRRLNGCAAHRGGRFVALWVAADLSGPRRATVLAHELAHILVPEAEHLDERAGARGILTGNGNSDTPTPEDMLELAQHASVTLPD